MPSGLTLYWFINNIISTAMQLYMRNTIKVDIPAMAPEGGAAGPIIDVSSTVIKPKEDRSKQVSGRDSCSLVQGGISSIKHGSVLLLSVTVGGHCHHGLSCVQMSKSACKGVLVTWVAGHLACRSLARSLVRARRRVMQPHPQQPHQQPAAARSHLGGRSSGHASLVRLLLRPLYWQARGSQQRMVLLLSVKQLPWLHPQPPVNRNHSRCLMHHHQRTEHSSSSGGVSFFAVVAAGLRRGNMHCSAAGVGRVGRVLQA